MYNSVAILLDSFLIKQEKMLFLIILLLKKKRKFSFFFYLLRYLFEKKTIEFFSIEIKIKQINSFVMNRNFINFEINLELLKLIY